MSDGDRQASRPGELGRLSLPAMAAMAAEPAAENAFAPFTRLALRAHGAPINPHGPGAVAALVLEGGSGLQLHAVAGRSDGEALPLAVIRKQMEKRRRILVEILDLAADPSHARAPAAERDSGFVSLFGAVVRDSAGAAIGMLLLLDREPRRHSREIMLTLSDLARGIAAVQAARGGARHDEPGLLDDVTGLPGRRALVGQLERMVRAAPGARGATPGFGLFRIDFGRLTALNEAYGRDVADRFLRQLADRLQTVTPVPGFLAHLGGSGFAIVAPGRAGNSDAEAMALRMMERLREPAQLDALELPVRLSIGVALYPADAATAATATEDAAAILLAADAALAHAKTEGDGRHSRATPEVIGAYAVSNGLELDLQAAVGAGSFTLHWMASIDTATEQVTGFEALVRWTRPGFGDVSPALFIPVAEAGGMIETLDAWVLREACREAQSWDTPITVAVNISPVWLSHGRLSRTLRRILDETGLDPGRLQLEFSARTTPDTDGHLRRELAQARAMGVTLALDDFGSGYSSLGALTLFPFNKVKLDRQFIAALGQDRRVETITRSVLQMVQSLGMTCCAEGVETEAQLSFLDAHGCDEIQGYLLGRPAPVLPRGAAEAVAPEG